MFFRIVKGGIVRQWKKLALIALTVMLGVSLATAMLNVMRDVGDKINQELKTYGANLNVVPRGASYLGELYGIEEGAGVSDKYLREDELGRLKTIFWAYNIVDFASYLDAKVNRRGDLDKPHRRSPGGGDGGVRHRPGLPARHQTAPVSAPDAGVARKMKTHEKAHGVHQHDCPVADPSPLPHGRGASGHSHRFNRPLRHAGHLP